MRNNLLKFERQQNFVSYHSSSNQVQVIFKLLDFILVELCALVEALFQLLKKDVNLSSSVESTWILKRASIISVLCDRISFSVSR
jgi:hypothetical protein